MTHTERCDAYASDITDANANEIGFDVVRDRLALRLDEQVHRPFAVAVVDEADSILIDEARIPLVIAGDQDESELLAYRVDDLTRHFRESVEYTVDETGRNVVLTDAGIRAVEQAFACGNLFDDENL